MSKSATDSLPRAEPLLRTRGLEKHYGQGEGRVRALDSVELEVAAGSRPCCICWAAWNAPRREPCGWRGAESTS